MARTARGIYHKYNVLKYRILNLLYITYTNVEGEASLSESKWLSTPVIGEILGVETGAFTGMLNKYRKYGLIKRSQRRYKPKGASHSSYKWTITERGMLVYFDLKNRLEHGQTLNRKEHGKLTSYVGLTKQGALEFGLTKEDTKEIQSQFTSITDDKT